ncbi:MAG TPA: amino acid hydroxylase [Herpetosiphonaceae bacterium]
METSVPMLPIIEYSQEEHTTWQRLYTRQVGIVQHVACQGFHAGFPRLGIGVARIPDPNAISARLAETVGWQLVSAENKFLDASAWFDHLLHRRFPVTDYIRRPHEFDFCELPDLFHEYFGHLSLLTLPSIADISQYFGQIARRARTERQLLDIARLWWFIFEVGFIREEGDLKVIGGALLSSPGELHHACRPEVPKYPFEIERVTQTPGMYYTYHDHYFYIESVAQIRQILDTYAQREGLAP